MAFDNVFYCLSLAVLYVREVFGTNYFTNNKYDYPLKKYWTFSNVLLVSSHSSDHPQCVSGILYTTDDILAQYLTPSAALILSFHSTEHHVA